MKKREVFLVIVIIVVGVIYNWVEKGELPFFDSIAPVTSRSLTDRSHPVSFPQEDIHYAETGNLQKVKIDNPAGHMEVVKSTDGSIRIAPLVRIYNRSKKQAEKMAKDISIQSREMGQALVVEVNTGDKDFPYRRARVSFKLYIPDGIDLEIKNRQGNVDIQETTGNILVNQGSGELFMKNINGELDVRAHNADVRLYDIPNHISLSTSNSKVKVRGVNSMKVKCSHVNLTVEDVAEVIDIPNAGYSTVIIEKSGPLTIDGEHTKISARKINGNVNIRDSHSTVRLNEVKGDIKLDGRSCRMILDDIDTGKMFLKNTFHSVEVDNVSGRNLEFQLQNARLTLDLVKVEESVNINGKNGRVTFRYPMTMNPKFNIKTYNADIIDNAGSGGELVKERHQQSLSTQEGTPSVSIDTDYGSVTLERISGSEKVKTIEI